MSSSQADPIASPDRTAVTRTLRRYDPAVGVVVVVSSAMHSAIALLDGEALS